MQAYISCSVKIYTNYTKEPSLDQIDIYIPSAVFFPFLFVVVGDTLGTVYLSSRLAILAISSTFSYKYKILSFFFHCDSGIVGQSWSIVFSTRGCHVNIFDTDQEKLAQGMALIKTKMTNLEAIGSLRGTLSAAEAFKLISPATCVKDCVTDACYIQVFFLY